MSEYEAEMRRTALRAAIQMGGASMPLSQAVEDLISAVACRLDEEDTQQIISFIQRSIRPRAADGGAAPQAIGEDIHDGNHGEDWR
jgi:hypothetical protein